MDKIDERVHGGVKHKNKPERQDSLGDQMRDLAIIADREGMYHVAVWIRESMNGKKQKKQKKGR